MFQFLGRNSGRSDRAPLLRLWLRLLVSIPRSEFWSFGPAADTSYTAVLYLFQFLGRNSGRSDGRDLTGEDLETLVSIPRSEFWSFGPARPGIGKSALLGVSIPRSEFWSFGPEPPPRPM